MSLELVRTLAETSERHGFVFSTVARSDGTELARYGDPSTLKWQGMIKSLFGSGDAVRRTLAALDIGHARVLAQGGVRCTYMRPRTDLLVGFFSQDGRGAVELQELGLAICGELAAGGE
jgi:hypothetical protein